MLATILKSDVATEVSIRIMDTFVKMRHYINYNKNVLPRRFLLLEDKVDDNTTVNVKDVKIEEEGEIDFEFSTTIPKDAEGTVGYDFEVNPEIGTKDDDSTVNAKDVKIEEEGEVDFEFEAPEGSERTVPEEEPNTQPIDDKCCEDVDFEFAEAASEEINGIDKDVESIEDPETYLDDDAIEDVESKDPKVSLDYDPSDEEVIDFVIKN